MKIIFVLVLLMLSGCATPPYRTGTIAVQKFTTTNFETNNPFMVKQDAVDKISEQLQTEIKTQVEEKTKMRLGANCLSSDYELIGRVLRVDSDVDSSLRPFHFSVYNRFSVHFDSNLIDCKTQKIVKNLSHNESEKNMIKVIGKLGDYIRNRIKFDERE